VARSVNLDDLLEEPAEITLGGQRYVVPELDTEEAARLYKVLEDVQTASDSADLGIFRRAMQDGADVVGVLLARGFQGEGDPPPLRLTETQLTQAILVLLGKDDPSEVMSGGAEASGPLVKETESPSAKPSLSGSSSLPSDTDGRTGAESPGVSSAAPSASLSQSPVAAR
jgi:hypothetical protein